MTRQEILDKMAELAAAWYVEKDKTTKNSLSAQWFELAKSLPEK